MGSTVMVSGSSGAKRPMAKMAAPVRMEASMLRHFSQAVSALMNRYAHSREDKIIEAGGLLKNMYG